MVPRVESADFAIALLLGELHSLLDHPFLQLAGSRTPPAALLVFLIQQNDYRYRARRTGEVRIHNVQILVAREHPHVHVAYRLGELGDYWNDVHRIPTPILGQHQQMPMSAQRFDACRDLDGDGDPLVERQPHLMILGGPSHELGESLTLAVSCFSDQGKGEGGRGKREAGSGNGKPETGNGKRETVLWLVAASGSCRRE